MAAAYGYPDEPTWWKKYQEECAQCYFEAGRIPTLESPPPDWSALRYFSRAGWDIADRLTPAASAAKHLKELRQELGIWQAPPISPTGGNLVVRGEFFALDTGEPWTAVQCSDFNLLARYLAGQDIRPILLQRADLGFNLLRVWTLFEIPGIGTLLESSLDYERIPEFVALCAKCGLFVEFTVYTGINPPDHWQRLCDAALQCQPYPLLELVNELSENTNEPDPQGRVFDLNLHSQAPAPLLSSHGSNGSQRAPVRPWWSYEEFHTNDAPEWHRKAGHNAMECSSGADGLVASHVPTLSNENTRLADKDPSLHHAADAPAGAALLCAGACFHSPEGKTSDLFDGATLEAARAWADGARSVPLKYQKGRYLHRSDLEVPGKDLRVYERRNDIPNGDPDQDGTGHIVHIRI